MGQANSSSDDTVALPSDIGFIGVGALATALAQALHRAWPDCRIHVSPRGQQASLHLQQHCKAIGHASNQEVADAAQWLVLGVRPAQLASLSNELDLTPQHLVLVLAAGTPLSQLQDWFAPAQLVRVMTGLAVAGGSSAVSLFPRSDQAAALLRPACASLLQFDTELQFEAAILAVCANAWWLDQLAALTDCLVAATGMPPEQAQALLTANLADVAVMVRTYPQHLPRELARMVGAPGTYTAQGLALLAQGRAHQPWEQCLLLVLERLRGHIP